MGKSDWLVIKRNVMFICCQYERLGKAYKVVYFLKHDCFKKNPDWLQIEQKCLERGAGD